MEATQLNFLSSHNAPYDGERSEFPGENQFPMNKSFMESPMDAQDNFSPDRWNPGSLFHGLSDVYARLILVTAAFMVLTEVLQTSVPLFYFHEYVFNLLLFGGIVCLVRIYTRAWSYRTQNSIAVGHSVNGNPTLCSFNYFEQVIPCEINRLFRIGVLILALGMLASCGLEAISILSMPERCMYSLHSIQPMLRGLFVLLQMFLLFVNLEAIIKTFGWFHHVSMMHLIVTNLAIWIRIMLWESSKIWLDASHHKHNSSLSWNNNDVNLTLHTLESDIESKNHLQHIPSHKVHFSTNCYWSAEAEQTESMIAFDLCLQNTTVGKIWGKILPYVYPIIIQYCLTNSGIIYLMWSNSQIKPSQLHFSLNYMNHNVQNRIKSSSYAGSTKGFSVGVLILLIGVIITLLFFIIPKTTELDMVFVVDVLQCIIFSISSLASVLELFHLRKKPSIPVQQKLIHTIFQEIGTLSVYSYGVCNVIVGSISFINTKLILFQGILMILHAATQSLYLRQVLRRKIDSADLNTKPKAQIAIMLAVINIMLWIQDTFITQNQVVNQIQREFFGKIAWPVICKVLLPFVAFYRFHSAVLLIEAWKKYYSRT